jgi:hypothetical protein
MNKLNGQCPECRKPAPFCDCKSSEELTIFQNKSKLIMKTVLQDLIQWTTENAFNIEGQDGEKYIAIDLQEMRQHFAKWLEQEKKQIIDAYEKGSTNKGNAKKYVAEKYIWEEL